MAEALKGGRLNTVYYIYKNPRFHHYPEPRLPQTVTIQNPYRNTSIHP